MSMGRTAFLFANTEEAGSMPYVAVFILTDVSYRSKPNSLVLPHMCSLDSHTWLFSFSLAGSSRACTE